MIQGLIDQPQVMAVSREPGARRRSCAHVLDTSPQGGKTKLTNHRTATILHAFGCGSRQLSELAGIKAETLSHWMGWSGEPYETFQRSLRKAEAGLGTGFGMQIVPPKRSEYVRWLARSTT
jgi:hypothetical protein